MCAVSGGTFMLNTDIDEILFDEAGKVSGVRNGQDVHNLLLFYSIVIFL